MEELIRSKYTSHRRALTEEKENEIPGWFEKASEAGQEVTVKEIEAAFDEARGKDPREWIHLHAAEAAWVTESDAKVKASEGSI